MMTNTALALIAAASLIALQYSVHALPVLPDAVVGQDEDVQLSAAQLQDAQQLFNDSDVDQNEQLTFEEFSTLPSDDVINGEYKQLLFAFADANRDGSLSSSEFTDFYMKLTKEVNGQYDDDELGRILKAYDWFLKYDGDKDGTTALDEANNMVEAEHQQQFSPGKPAIAILFDQSDTDKNEKLTFLEYVLFVTAVEDGFKKAEEGKNSATGGDVTDHMEPAEGVTAATEASRDLVLAPVVAEKILLPPPVFAYNATTNNDTAEPFDHPVPDVDDEGSPFDPTELTNPEGAEAPPPPPPASASPLLTADDSTFPIPSPEIALEQTQNESDFETFVAAPMPVAAPPPFNQQPSTELNKAIVRMADMDGDLLLDYGEVLDFIRVFIRPRNYLLLESMFINADKDSDRRLNTEEYADFLKTVIDACSLLTEDRCDELKSATFGDPLNEETTAPLIIAAPPSAQPPAILPTFMQQNPLDNDTAAIVAPPEEGEEEPETAPRAQPIEDFSLVHDLFTALNQPDERVPDHFDPHPMPFFPMPFAAPMPPNIRGEDDDESGERPPIALLFIDAEEQPNNEDSLRQEEEGPTVIIVDDRTPAKENSEELKNKKEGDNAAEKTSAENKTEEGKGRKKSKSSSSSQSKEAKGGKKGGKKSSSSSQSKEEKESEAKVTTTETPVLVQDGSAAANRGSDVLMVRVDEGNSGYLRRLSEGDSMMVLLILLMLLAVLLGLLFARRVQHRKEKMITVS